MNCEQVVQHLWSFLDRELDEETSADLTRHLEECRRCFTRAEFERRLKAMVRQSCECDRPPSDLQARLRRVFRSF